MEYFKFIKPAVVIGISSLSLFLALAPAQAAQQFTCNGRMKNGRTFSATFLNGLFTQIRWEQSGQPPQVTPLTFSSTNSLGQPVYRGSFQAATAVTLVDISKGDVRRGSEVSVGVEEWGWARGVCGTSTSSGGSGGSSGGSGTTDWFSQLRQDLIGVSGARSRDWMSQNNFFFDQTMEHTDTRVIERWNRPSDSSTVEVVITNNVVSDVVRVR